jgi:site-specific recombinase XerD
LLDTGVRLNELVNIKTKNVFLIDKKIILDETKNGKKRIVSFGVLSETLINQVYDQTHSFLLWNNIQDVPLKKRSLEHFFMKMNRDVQFSSPVHAHRIRKTFATKLLKMGCPLTTIQKLLGHSSITQTMIYLEVDNEMIDSDYRKYYPF